MARADRAVQIPMSAPRLNTLNVAAAGSDRRQRTEGRAAARRARNPIRLFPSQAINRMDSIPSW